MTTATNELITVANAVWLRNAERAYDLALLHYIDKMNAEIAVCTADYDGTFWINYIIQCCNEQDFIRANSFVKPSNAN